MITDLLIIIFILIIILIYRIYKYNYNNIYSITFNSYFDDNYNIEVKMFIFKIISKFTYFNWNSKDNYFNLFNTTMYYFYNSFNCNKTNKYCLLFFDYNPKTNVYVSISDVLFINKNEQLTSEDLFNKIKWNELAFKNTNNENYLIIVIKPYNSNNKNIEIFIPLL